MYIYIYIYIHTYIHTYIHSSGSSSSKKTNNEKAGRKLILRHLYIHIQIDRLIKLKRAPNLISPYVHLFTIVLMK